jgi:membrane protease YdiL (CAAX protease family)
MPKDTRPRLPDPVPDRALGPFLGVAFGLAWGIFALFAFFPDPITRWFGAPGAAHPLFILAVWAPAIAAFALVWRHAGRAGLGRFLARLLLWRMPGLWWAVLILGVPAVYMAGAAAMGRPLLAQAGSVGALIAAMAFMAILGPVEEFGWRGLMLPLLQRRMAPVWAGLVTGVVWGLWHLPAFFLSGTPQSGWDFTPFFAGAVGASLIVTAMFNASRGSLLVAMLFHYSLNFPLWPDGQPWDMWLFAGMGVLVAVVCRGTMFSRAAGVAQVVPAASSGEKYSRG